MAPHACHLTSFVANACSVLYSQIGLYNGTTQLYSNFNNLTQRTLIAPTAFNYWTLLCAPGYRGVLCGVCDQGYGQTDVATCGKCPTGNFSAAVYVAIAMVNVVLVILAIKGQMNMLSEDTTGLELDDEEKAEVLLEAERHFVINCTASGGRAGAELEVEGGEPGAAVHPEGKLE